MNNPANKFSFQSTLIQDVIVEDGLSVSGNLYAVQNPISKVSEVIACNLPNATYVRRDEQSDTGWVAMSLPYYITHITYLEDNNGDRTYYAICRDGNDGNQAVYTLVYDSTNCTYVTGAHVGPVPKYAISQFIGMKAYGNRLIVVTALSATNQALRTRERRWRHQSPNVIPKLPSKENKLGATLGPIVESHHHHHCPSFPVGPNSGYLIAQDGYFIITSSNKPLSIRNVSTLKQSVSSPFMTTPTNELFMIDQLQISKTCPEVGTNLQNLSGSYEFSHVEVGHCTPENYESSSNVLFARQANTNNLFTLSFATGSPSWTEVASFDEQEPVLVSNQFKPFYRSDRKIGPYSYCRQSPRKSGYQQRIWRPDCTEYHATEQGSGNGSNAK